MLSDIDLINFGDLESLLERHLPLLKKLASDHIRKFPNTIFDDCLQNARLGAILATQRFNKDSSVKFITFLHKTVYYHLLSCNDSEALVNCPTNVRKVKSYFAGKYDTNHTKKIAFEKKYNLNNTDDIQNLENEYRILGSESVFTTEMLPEVLDSSENQTVCDVNTKITIDSFPEEEREIAYLLIEGETISNIARIFSDKYNTKYSDKQIKRKIGHIQQYFSV